MNIIEAIKKAENGSLITMGIMYYSNSFLKYEGAGVFAKYSLVNGTPVLLNMVKSFSMAEILSIDWIALPEMNKLNN